MIRFCAFGFQYLFFGWNEPPSLAHACRMCFTPIANSIIRSGGSKRLVCHTIAEREISCHYKSITPPLCLCFHNHKSQFSLNVKICKSRGNETYKGFSGKKSLGLHSKSWAILFNWERLYLCI